MRKRQPVEVEPKSGRMEESCKRYGLGRSAMREAADKAGAVVKVGRSYLINFDVMDKYIDDLTGKR